MSPAESTTPVNGELRGPDSQAVVTQVAWPSEADGYVANTGDRLVALTVQLTEPTSDVTAFTSTGPTRSLVVDGSPQTLDTRTISNGVGSASPNAATGTGTESYVASVSNATHDVELSMTDAGYAQSFSLWSLTRDPGAPSVLYDDPTGSNVTEQLGITKPVTLREPSGITHPVNYFVTSALLSAFRPGSTDVTAPKGYAYLDGLGRQRPRTAAVAPRRALEAPLEALGADHVGRLSFDQRLVEERDHLSNQIEVGSLIECVEQCRRVKLCMGHRSSPSVSLSRDTSKLLRWPDYVRDPPIATTSGDVNRPCRRGSLQLGSQRDYRSSLKCPSVGVDCWLDTYSFPCQKGISAFFVPSARDAYCTMRASLSAVLRGLGCAVGGAWHSPPQRWFGPVVALQ